MVAVAWTGKHVDVAGVKMHLSRAGKGAPLLVLHHDIGTLERLPVYDALAQHFDVLVPHHPGYGKSERPAWLRSVRDVAVMYRQLLADLGINQASLIGLGFGGWVAQTWGWRTAYLAAAAGALVIGAAFFLLVRDAPPGSTPPAIRPSQAARPSRATPSGVLA